MISGPNVRLRPFDRKHLDRTRAWANDPDLALLLDRSRPVSDASHEQWFASLQSSTDTVMFACESGEEHVGNVWLWGIDWRNHKAEVRIVFGAQQGRGLGTEAVRLITQYAFERLNLRRLYAYVLAHNPRARRAFEKAGYVAEGTLRQDRWSGREYVDVHLLARLRDEASRPIP
jgi:RimJ/RimL family protein N-acetyltransferase